MGLLGALGEAFRGGIADTQTRRRHTRTRRGKRPFRPNPWPKCRGDNGGCWHRVHPRSIHWLPSCRRAWPHGPALPLTHSSGYPCCPGECRYCRNCYDRHELCGTCGACIEKCHGQHDDEEGKQ